MVIIIIVIIVIIIIIIINNSNNNNNNNKISNGNSNKAILRNLASMCRRWIVIVLFNNRAKIEKSQRNTLALWMEKAGMTKPYDGTFYDTNDQLFADTDCDGQEEYWL